MQSRLSLSEQHSVQTEMQRFHAEMAPLNSAPSAQRVSLVSTTHNLQSAYIAVTGPAPATLKWGGLTDFPRAGVPEAFCDCFRGCMLCGL